MFRLLDKNYIVIDCYDNLNDLYFDAFDLISTFKELYYTIPDTYKIKRVDLSGYQLASNYKGNARLVFGSILKLPICEGCIMSAGPHWQIYSDKVTINIDKCAKYVYIINVKNLTGYKIDYNHIPNLVKHITNAKECDRDKQEVYSYKDVKILHLEEYELSAGYNLYIIEGECVDKSYISVVK